MGENTWRWSLSHAAQCHSYEWDCHKMPGFQWILSLESKSRVDLDGTCLWNA